MPEMKVENVGNEIIINAITTTTMIIIMKEQRISMPAAAKEKEKL